jgi:peptidoglycan/LPS O-acetylase OafA/YrhL
MNSATPPAPIAKTPENYDTVDVLRGISILAVVLLHIRNLLRAAGHTVAPALPPSLNRLLFNNGMYAVTIFFAVSGFLISMTSMRRFGSLSKMLVALSALQLAHARGFYIDPGQTSLGRAVFAVLTFHSNWLEALHGFLPPSWSVLWSLSVEEMFYLFFPLLCVALLRPRARMALSGSVGMGLFITVLLAFVAMGPLARTIWAFNEAWREKSYLGGMDGIALGCLSALLTHPLLERMNKNAKGAEAWRSGHALSLLGVEIAGSALILVSFVRRPLHLMLFIAHVGLDGTLLAAGTCLVMVASVLRGRKARGWTFPLRWFGRHSYEVYLTHEFCLIWGIALYARLNRGRQVLWIVVLILLTALLGALVAKCYSEPLNRILRGRNSRRGAISAGA